MPLIFLVLLLAGPEAWSDQTTLEPQKMRRCADLLSANELSVRDWVMRSALPIFFNTGNPDKLHDLTIMKRRFGARFQFQDYEHPEPKVQDPFYVAAFKASRAAVNNRIVFIEDTSFDVHPTDGRPQPEIGVNIKWLVGSIPNWAGQPATWTSCVAFVFQGKVYIYRGVVHGEIRKSPFMPARDFGQNFIPRGREKSYNEVTLDEMTEGDNPRLQALIKFYSGESPDAIMDRVEDWEWSNGPWQGPEI
jgi:inosine/xanthosine triphosphate pyrophosphatase family protein